MKTLAERLARTAPQAIDMHGFAWDRWRVVGKGEPRWSGKRSWATWVCRCECGAEVTTDGGKLRNEAQRTRIKCWRCDP